MRVVRVSLLAAAIASISTATLAADFPPPAADFPPPLPAVALIESGWYLRGDIGVGQLHSKQLEWIPSPIDAGIDFGPQPGARGTAPDHTNWNFAWAVHAGLAFTASPNLTLELAYRYLDRGSAWASVNCFGGCSPDMYRLRDIASQDIKIGRRWLLQPEQAVFAPPLIRKG